MLTPLTRNAIIHQCFGARPVVFMLFVLEVWFVLKGEYMKKVLNVTSPLMPSFDKYVEKLKTIWESKWMTNNGSLCTELQQKLISLMQGSNVELYVNGHMALDIAIKALKLKGEVITTPFTFASTTHALIMNGITPVFCDIKEDDYTIDENKIESLITDKTSAILPVHVYGCPCNVEKIADIAKRHKLKVIYDAAHAFGVYNNGTPLACCGDVSMLSFHATKVFNTIEGGALVFSDDSLSKPLRNLRNFGIENAESVTQVGLNAKMNEFAAAMGICNLELVNAAIARRKELVEQYVEVCSKLPGIRVLDYDGMQKRGIVYNYAYMPIEVDETVCSFTRDELCNIMKEKNVILRKYFFPLIVDFECYKDQYGFYELPVARRVANHIVTLPLSGDMDNDDVKRCCDILISYSKRNR